jgi:Holliday junction resolvase RusA-like endonuclease
LRRSFHILLPYPPVSGNHATKHTRAGRHYTTDTARAYANDVVEQAHRSLVAGLKLSGPLSVVYHAYPPDGRDRDSCNVMKIAKDAITKAGVWVDDNNKVLVREEIEWFDIKPGGLLSVFIEELS